MQSNTNMTDTEERDIAVAVFREPTIEGEKAICEELGLTHEEVAKLRFKHFGRQRRCKWENERISTYRVLLASMKVREAARAEAAAAAARAAEEEANRPVTITVTGGGYDMSVTGEDAEMIMRIHAFRTQLSQQFPGERWVIFEDPEDPEDLIAEFAPDKKSETMIPEVIHDAPSQMSTRTRFTNWLRIRLENAFRACRAG